MEKPEKKANPLPHGAGRRIALAVGVSAKLVSRALNGHPGVSRETQLKVARAARTVLRSMACEQLRFAKKLAALGL